MRGRVREERRGESEMRVRDERRRPSPGFRRVCVGRVYLDDHVCLGHGGKALQCAEGGDDERIRFARVAGGSEDDYGRSRGDGDALEVIDLYSLGAERSLSGAQIQGGTRRYEEIRGDSMRAHLVRLATPVEQLDTWPALAEVAVRDLHARTRTVQRLAVTAESRVRGWQ